MACTHPDLPSVVPALDDLPPSIVPVGAHLVAEMDFPGRRFGRRCGGAQRIVSPAHSPPGSRLPVLLDRHLISPVGRPPPCGSDTGGGNSLNRSIRSLSAVTRMQRAQGRKRTGTQRPGLLAGDPNRRCFTCSVRVDRRVRQREQEFILDHPRQLDPSAGTYQRIQPSRFNPLAVDHHDLEPRAEGPVEPSETPLTDERQHSLHVSEHLRPSRDVPCELDVVRNLARPGGDEFEEARHRCRVDGSGENRPSGSELFHVQYPPNARWFPHFLPAPGSGLEPDGIACAADGKERALSVSKRSARPGTALPPRYSRRDRVANVSRHRL